MAPALAGFDFQGNQNWFYDSRNNKIIIGTTVKYGYTFEGRR